MGLAGGGPLLYFLRKGRGLGGKRTDAGWERTGKIWLRRGLGCGMIWEMENNGRHAARHLTVGGIPVRLKAGKREIKAYF